jgi:hypothetical protein
LDLPERAAQGFVVRIELPPGLQECSGIVTFAGPEGELGARDSGLHPARFEGQRLAVVPQRGLVVAAAACSAMIP